MDSRGETSVGQLNNRPPLSPQPSSLPIYVYCNTAERYIPETPRRFFSQLHTSLSLSFSPLFFLSFDKQTTQYKGYETGHVRRELSYSSRVIVE